MEQYLALDHGDIRRGVRRHEIERNVDFEIKCQFLRELRDHTFSGNENNVHAIKGRYESGDEMYYHASEKVKCVQATKYKEDSLMMKPGNNSPSGNNSKVEETLGKYLEESCKRHDIFDELMKRFKENINKNLRKHDSAIKGLEENVTRLAQAVKTHNKINQDKALDIKSSIIISPLSVNSNVVHGTNSIGQEIIKKIGEKDGSPKETPTKEPGTFAEKVKRRIKEEQEKGERLLESLEKEPVNTPLVNTISFILSCIIGNTKVINALADLGASISVMPFSMFKRLGLGTPTPVSMVIEMANRYMQSPKGIVENVLVKIDKFIFLVDFVILDIVEDNKVPIILGRPMLSTAHARIDIFGRKISLEVGTEKFVFNANEGKTPLSVCVINDFEVPGEFEEPREILPDSDDEMEIKLEELEERNEKFWDAQDPIIAHDINPPLRPQFLGVGNRIHKQNPYTLQITCKIRKQFCWDGKKLTCVRGMPHFLNRFHYLGECIKECVGLDEDVTEGILWFKN
ncbi:hypothetical protein Tco_1459597 [Tanacetum coccineum]